MSNKVGKGSNQDFYLNLQVLTIILHLTEFFIWNTLLKKSHVISYLWLEKHQKSELPLINQISLCELSKCPFGYSILKLKNSIDSLHPKTYNL